MNDTIYINIILKYIYCITGWYKMCKKYKPTIKEGNCKSNKKFYKKPSKNKIITPKVKKW